MWNLKKEKDFGWLGNGAATTRQDQMKTLCYQNEKEM